MARKKVPASAGFYMVVYDFPGVQDWVEDTHVAFDKWTLALAQEGPSESVAILPSFEVMPADEDEPWRLRLTFVKVTADSAWLATLATVETLNIIAPQLLDEGIAFRIFVNAEEVIGRDVAVDVPDD
jgi:hypothetical protein